MRLFNLEMIHIYVSAARITPVSIARDYSITHSTWEPSLESVV